VDSIGNTSPGFDDGANPDIIQLLTAQSGQPDPFDMVKGNDLLGLETETAGPAPGSAPLLSDTFDRPDNPVVGEGWVEVEQAGPPVATVSLADNKLFFDDTSDVPFRPMVRRGFPRVSTGSIQWEFDFDWARTLTDPGYELWMQLGDSTLMVDPIGNLTRFTGVGVNLRWGSNAGIDQRLVARQDATMGGPAGLAVISGPTHLSVTADLATRTYSVTIDGVLVSSGLSFDNISTVSSLDSVRIYTNSLDEQNFSGRTFDNLIISTVGGGNTPPVADTGDDQNVNTGATVLLDGSTSTDADGDPLTYAWTLTEMPSGSTASLTGTATAGPSFVADLAGTYQAELVVNDGTDDSAPDVVTITAAGPTVLLRDTFDRPDSLDLGPNWVRVVEAGASVVIADQKLFFADTSDFVNRPLVRRSFPQVSTGTLRWDFDFDWARTGPEGIYEFLMQLGDGKVMSDNSPGEGAGVYLVWSVIDGVHQSLGYRRAGVDTALAVLSGPAAISVAADLDSRTYSVMVNGAVIGTGIPFDGNVPLETVSLVTANLNEQNFSGRTIDNLSIVSAPLDDSFDRADSPVVGEGWIEVEEPGASVAIASQKLFFTETSEDNNTEDNNTDDNNTEDNNTDDNNTEDNITALVRRAFTEASTGTLQWDFDFDWTRTGDEAAYRFLMQLGDSNLMSETAEDGGAGLNLIWTSIDGLHQTLGYRQGNVITPLAVLSGAAAISVLADLDTRNYSVSINGTVAGSGIPFDADVSLNTVRFIAHNLDQQAFSGHTIDKLKISRVLLQDSFDREDGRSAGPGWVEVEEVGASAAVGNQKLFFADASDIVNRPLVRGLFTQASTGTLQWDLDFDWARSGPERGYRVLMQLGDGGIMSDSAPYAGAGVSLVWTVINGVHQSLGYRQGGVDNALAVLSGPAAISVTADLDRRTYSVSVNGAVLGSGIPFAANVALDTVRFLTTNLNEENISGRTFDNVVITR
jgi:uncharacterized membrane protein